MGLLREVAFLSDGEVKKKVIEAVTTYGNAVSSTLGPNGSTVLIENRMTGGDNKVTKDGVTVSQEIMFADPIKRTVVEIIKQAAQKTDDVAGDGTTTSTIIATEIIKQVLLAEGDGITVDYVFKKSLLEGLNIILEHINNATVKLGDEHDKGLEQIATISANNDKEIGSLVAQAFQQVGLDAIVEIDDSETSETTLHVTRGLNFPQGWRKPEFINNLERRQTEFEKPMILCIAEDLRTSDQLSFILEKYITKYNKRESGILIICKDIRDGALEFLVENTRRRNISLCVVRCHGFDKPQLENLQDLAIATGATVFGKEVGIPLTDYKESYAGFAESCTVGEASTNIIGGNGVQEKIDVQVASIKTEMETAESEYRKGKLKDRIALLTGKGCIIKVGAVLQAEAIEKKDRIVDAIKAVYSTIKDGYVEGGGYTLKMAQLSLELKANEQNMDAFNVLAKAISTPYKMILLSIMDRQTALDNYSLNAKVNGVDGSFIESYLEEGIVDPALVTKNAIENGVRAALSIIGSKCIVYNAEEKEKMLIA